MSEIHCTVAHYVIPVGINAQGDCRPALVVREHSPKDVNLQVFLDGKHDVGHSGRHIEYLEHVARDDHSLKPNTFHLADTCPHRK